MSHTLQEVAKITGLHYAVVKKHAQRGKLKTSLEGRNRVVSDDDLAAYQASDALDKLSDALRDVDGDVKELKIASGEAGNHISRLPSHIRDAILNGMPKTGKGGHVGRSTDYLTAIEGVPTNPELEEPDEDVDPHGGRKIGFQWAETPRWKRVSESTWAIGNAKWTWNGLGWEGSGAAAGRELGEGVSPANPYSSKRPLAPSKKAADG